MSKTSGHSASTFSVRIDPYYIVGAKLVIEKKQAQGFVNPNRTTVIREGLEAIFEKYGISTEDIEKALNGPDEES